MQIVLYPNQQIMLTAHTPHLNSTIPARTFRRPSSVLLIVRCLSLSGGFAAAPQAKPPAPRGSARGWPPHISHPGCGSALFAADVGFDFFIRKNEAIFCCIVRTSGFVCGGWSRLLPLIVQFI